MKAFLTLLLLTLIGVGYLIFKGVSTTQKATSQTVLEYTTHSVKKIDNTTGKGEITASLVPINYVDKNGNWHEYDTTIIESSSDDYDFELKSADFQVYFKSKIEDHLIKVVRNGYEIFLTPQPLEYRNAGKTQLVAKPVHNPQITTLDNTIIYKDIYGPGIDLRFIVTSSKIAKELIIQEKTALPQPTITEAELSFALGFIPPNNTHITTAGEVWDGTSNTSTTDNVNIVEDTPVKNEFNSGSQSDSIFGFSPPFAFDASAPSDRISLTPLPGNNEKFFMTFALENKNGKQVVADTPYSWLENATYPVIIDPTLNLQINVGGNDGSWINSFDAVSTTATQMLLGNVSPYGPLDSFLRFTNVTVPQGATIDTAYITVEAQGTTSGNTTNLIIRAVDADNASAPTESDSASVPEGATRTTANTTWSSIAQFTVGNTYNSPSIVNVIKEIVDRPGWSSGNAMVIYVEDNSSSTNAWRNVDTYETTSGGPAILHIEYSTTPTNTPTPSPTPTPVPGVLNVEGVDLEGINLD